jgi:hypothetical protein
MFVEELLRECERTWEVDWVRECIDGRREAVSITMWSNANGADPGVANPDLAGGLIDLRVANCGK